MCTCGHATGWHYEHKGHCLECNCLGYRPALIGAVAETPENVPARILGARLLSEVQEGGTRGTRVTLEAPDCRAVVALATDAVHWRKAWVRRGEGIAMWRRVAVTPRQRWEALRGAWAAQRLAAQASATALEVARRELEHERRAVARLREELTAANAARDDALMQASEAAERAHREAEAATTMVRALGTKHGRQVADMEDRAEKLRLSRRGARGARACGAARRGSGVRP